MRGLAVVSRLVAVAGAVASTWFAPARAEVKEATTSGFTVENVIQVPADFTTSRSSRR